VKVDRDLPWDLAAVFGCAVLTDVGAAVYAAGVQQGERVAVFGLGGVVLATGAARRPAPDASHRAASPSRRRSRAGLRRHPRPVSAIRGHQLPHIGSQ
jgi:Zn-dependent alcohol dehydrogenase